MKTTNQNIINNYSQNSITGELQFYGDSYYNPDGCDCCNTAPALIKTAKDGNNIPHILCFSCSDALQFGQIFSKGGK